jgi:lipopolysaccharide transport system permease protein
VGATKQGCACFFAGETFLRQHSTPLAVFPLRVALTETFQFFMSLVVLLGLVWLAQGFQNLPVLVSLVPTVVLLFVLAWSLSLLAGFANVYVTDTQHVCDLAFQTLFYLTPIVYHTSDLGGGRLSWVVAHCNPIVPLLRLFREPILEGRVPALETYASGLAIVVAVAALASFAGLRAQRKLIFHL